MGDDVRRIGMIKLNSRPGKSHPEKKNRSSLEATRTQLRALSNTKLLQDLEDLNLKERKLKVLVLLYLSEIDSRGLYLPLGYGSLFDFCTMHLGYTRATAARRIRAARTVAKYPEALEMLRSGEIHITTLSMIGDILDGDNHEQLLQEIKHKSTRSVEMLVSRHRPVPAIRDTVRPVCVRRVESVPAEDADSKPAIAAGSVAGACRHDLSPTEDTEGRKCNKLSSSAETNAACGEGRTGSSGAETNSGRSGAETSSPPPGRVIIEQRLKLGFSVSPEFMKKYDTIKSLLSSKYPEGMDFETIFDILMNEYLERHDPERKLARRRKRAMARDATRRKPEVRSPRNAKSKKNLHPSRSKRGSSKKRSDTRSRNIPPDIRDRVYARDKGRCSFMGANGRRCHSTWDLEIDHIVPYARGGDNSLGNLRLLCRKHNMHQAERTYGREHMRRHERE